MKLKSIITTFGAAAVVACVALSCDKQVGKEVANENTDFTDKAFIQLYNAMPGSPSTIQMSVDANSVTGTGIGLGGVFPSTPANASIQNGFRAFLIRDAATTTTFPYMSFAENLQAGSYYTIFAYDSAITPKQKIVQNKIVVPTDTTARLRFANFTYNPTAIATGFDIYSVKTSITDCGV